MIEFSLNISHPFDIKFKNFWNKSWDTPIKNKFIELEIHTTDDLVGCNVLWTTERDHAGLDIQLSLFGICLHFNFYDSRHWDHEAGRYFEYGEH